MEYDCTNCGREKLGHEHPICSQCLRNREGRGRWIPIKPPVDSEMVELKEENKRLLKVVDKLDKTRDDVPVIAGDSLFAIEYNGEISQVTAEFGRKLVALHVDVSYEGGPWAIGDCFSTKEAAQTAQESSNG